MSQRHVSETDKDTVNKSARIRKIKVYRVNSMFFFTRSTRVFFFSILFDFSFKYRRTPVHFNLNQRRSSRALKLLIVEVILLMAEIRLTTWDGAKTRRK